MKTCSLGTHINEANLLKCVKLTNFSRTLFEIIKCPRFFLRYSVSCHENQFSPIVTTEFLLPENYLPLLFFTNFLSPFPFLFPEVKRATSVANRTSETGL